jgi:hypothetical protein
MKDKAVRRQVLANLERSDDLRAFDKRVLKIVKRDLEESGMSAEWENERKLRTFWRPRATKDAQPVQVCFIIFRAIVDRIC